jgi:hypothetical protein
MTCLLQSQVRDNDAFELHALIPGDHEPHQYGLALRIASRNVTIASQARQYFDVVCAAHHTNWPNVALVIDWLKCR